LFTFAGAAHAQWSSDPAANLAVADRTGDQVQPKLGMTSDGGCYLSWFDNATGGYDVYLQRLDASGVEQWEQNGVLLADRGVSSTVDYDLVVGSSGDAFVAFNDDRSGSNQITITRVSADGVQLWGEQGVTIPGSAGGNNPHVAVLTSGDIIVGWSQSPGVKLQRLSADGALLGATQTVSEAGRTISLSDLQPSDAGTFIALWIRPFSTSFLSSKYLYTQKFNDAFAPLWAPTPGFEAVAVYAPAPGSNWPTGTGTYGNQGGSVQNGYFPSFVSDGAGGAVFAWYENAGPRNAYLQHVLADGSLKFQANGIPNVLTGTDRIRLGAGLAFDAASGEYFVASPESQASPQDQYRTFVQKFNADGSFAFGDTGVTIIPSDTGNVPSFVQCVAVGDGGCMVFGQDSRNQAGTVHVIFGARVDGEGTVNWTNLPSSTVEAKARLASGWSTSGFAVVAFGGSANIYAQNVNPDGSFGAPPVACEPDLNCDGSPDQGDVACMILAVAGDISCICQDPDFNLDGSADQGDVAAIIGVVAGQPCP